MNDYQCKVRFRNLPGVGKSNKALTFVIVRIEPRHQRLNQIEASNELRQKNALGEITLYQHNAGRATF